MKTRIFLVVLAGFFITPAAYSDSDCILWMGHMWVGGYVGFYIDSSVPTEWAPSIADASGTWSTSGAGCFTIYPDIASSFTISTDDLGDINYGGVAGGRTSWHYTSSVLMKDAKTVFNNNSSITWSTAGTTPTGQYDVETVALHEFGHWLDLSDDYGNTGSIMFKDYQGERRQLTSDVTWCTYDIYCNSLGVCEYNCPSPPPGNFQAQIVGQDVQLTWTGPSPGTYWAGVNLFINASVVSIDYTAHSYTDQGAVNRFPVTYRLVATDINGLQSGTQVITFSSIPGGWNMMSVPSKVGDFSKTSVWPTAQSPAWELWQGSYIIGDPLWTGPGYWVEFQPGHQSMIEYLGDPLDKLPIAVFSGWNLIGAMHLPIQVATITSSPPGNIVTPYWGYTPGTGYYLASALQAGWGYWVEANVTGTVMLDPLSTANNPPPIVQNQPPSPPGAPPTPTPLSPANGSTGQALSLTLSWASSAGATKYHLRVSTDQSFQNSNDLVYENPNLTVTYGSLGGLNYSTTYYWEVNASDSVTSQWSNIYWFTTQSAPPGGGCKCCANSIAALDQFTISDDSGYSQRLYLVNGNRSLNLGFTQFEMPPPPPKGIFHARFSSGKFIESIPGNSQAQIHLPIMIKDGVFPLTIRWDLKLENSLRYSLTLPGGQGGSRVNLNNQTGSMVVAGTDNGALLLNVQPMQIAPCPPAQVTAKGNSDNEAQNETPAETKLLANYPNPFNPSTALNYQLAGSARVQLKVYNLLGEEVARLVDDESKTAGYYSAMWNATNVASGVYYVRMIAIDNSTNRVYENVSKLVLMK